MAGQTDTMTTTMQGPAAILAAVRERWTSMQPAQRRLLVLCMSALLLLSGVSVWWGNQTDWRTLFSGMNGRDAAQMQQQLSAAGVRFQTTPDGTAIQVPADQIDKARVAISANGLPQSGRLGFELFDKPNWVGSEFDEKVNYQRALEGELEHTISTLESVQSARVHIVLAKQGAFASEDQPAKASVVLKLRRSDLPHTQADAMRNLVAGAVEGLKPESVTLVDADGRSDLSPMTADSGSREEERALQAKLTQVLEPLAGAGNVHATVSLTFVQGSEEHTDEVYDPAGATPLSVHRTEQTSQQSRPSGVPGTQSNAPVAQPAANNAAPNATPAPAVAGASANSTSGQTQNARDENTQYAVTRHLTHTEEGPGRVRRVTAAIVLNDREIRQMSGKTMHTAWQHRSPEEMKQLQMLAQAAIGFDEKRGDTVVLQNIAFSNNADQAAASGVAKFTETATDLLRTQPGLLRTAGTLVGLLMLGMLVLRPLTRQTQQLLAAPAARPVLAGHTSAAELNAPQAGMGAPLSTQHIFDRVTEQIRTEAQSSTRLIGSWIASGAEERD